MRRGAILSTAALGVPLWLVLVALPRTASAAEPLEAGTGWPALTEAQSAPTTAPAPTTGPATEPASTPSTKPATEATPTAEPTTAPAPAPTPPAPAAEPFTIRWEDSDEMVAAAARGSINTCESLTFPLKLIPGAGDVISIVLEWACLVPGVFAVEYVEAHHGKRHHLYWQPAVALLLSRLYRDVIEYPAIAVAVVAGVAYAVVAVPALVFAPYFIPVGIAGLVTLGGVGYVVFKKVRDKGSDLVFDVSYKLMAPAYATTAEMDAAASESLLQPPLGGWTRAWALAAAAGGADPSWSITFWIPVVGPWIKASARNDAIKRTLRRTAHDVLNEEDASFDAADTTTDVLTVTEGLLGASGQALLLAGGGLFVAGAIFAGMEYQATEDLGRYAAIAAGTGTAGVAVAGTGLGLILLREVPEVLRPIAIPIAYGLFPPDEQAEGAAAAPVTP